MKRDKKHIDRLFQEGLKNFEATPNPSVWEHVSEQLAANKKQRKVIPLWIKLSSIAAGLLLLFTLGNNLFFQDNNIAPEIHETIVDTKTQSNQNPNNGTINSKSEGSSNATNKEDLANEEANINDTESSNSPIDTNKKFKNSTLIKNESVIAKNDTESFLNPSTKKDIVTQLIKQDTGNTIASNSQDNNAIEAQKNTSIATANNNKEELNEIEKISIEDAIADNNKAKEIEDDLEADSENSKRWSIAPSIAPVYFNSLGDGSSLHSEFSNNSKSGNINVSYGVFASYAVNDKINLRVGINNVKLGYDTHDVVGLNGVGSHPIKSIAVNNIAVSKSISNAPSVMNSVEMSFAQVPRTLSKEFKSSINQELGFLEIPLEIQYNITQSKLGVNAIGGFSALFLNTNEIYSTLNGNSTLIGKATNINNLSYSANLGLGFNYKVSNSININLEPMFKYQLNTFKNTSGNFKPYFIGVYSGLSFKF